MSMRFVSLIFVLGWLVGCGGDDPRLRGTWRSNREATVAAELQCNPDWTNNPPDRIERFREIFGDMVVSYSHGKVTSVYHGKVDTFGYHVVERGSNYVVIQTDAGIDSDRNIRIRFAEGNTNYWIESGFEIQERFDRVNAAR